MNSDPLDQLQAMFPSIEGDVIAIVLNESDKDVSVTVEKLLQLVPDEISNSEFPRLPSVTRTPQQHPNFLRSVSPQRSSSGPPGTSGQRGGDSAWTSQQRNRRLQGPVHIPPNAKQQQQQKVVGGTGNQKNQPKTRGQQNQRLHPQQEVRGAPAQSILGKRVPPSNQKRSGGVHHAGMGGSGENGSQREMFYQMGGSGANSSMPTALGAMDPAAASMYYHNTAAVPQHQSQARQTGFTGTSYPHPPAVQHHRAHTPVQHGGNQSQPGGNKHWPPTVISGGNNTYGGGGGGMYGYANFGQDGQYYGSWMNPGPRPGDYMDQFYRSGQQSWPNISESGLQYRGERETGTGTMRSYGGDYYSHVMGSLGGGDSNEGGKKSDWPMYPSESGSIQEHKANLDAIAALLHPETSPLTDGQFGRHGYVHSEPSSLSNLAGLVQRQSYEGEGVSGHVGGGERVEHRGKRDVAAAIGEERIGGAVSGGEGQSAGKGQSTAGGEVRSGGSDRKTRSERVKVGEGRGSKPKKLIILRGLPGSGKTTLARNRVGANGVICCTDDFFVNNGEYVFNPTLLEENHEKNRKKARDAMVTGHSPVIIDNTNTNAWEMKPYVLLAKEHGYSVEILEPDTPWRFKTNELARRNSHNVPKHKIEKMLERYDHRVTLETIVKSQPPERKPSTETGRSDDGNGGRRSKVSPPTPRHQQEGGSGSGNVDHTPAPAHQTIAVGGNAAPHTRSGRVSPAPRVEGRKGQRSNDGRVSPRPPNQKTQKSKDNAVARNGAERKPSSEGVASGGGQGKASDTKKKNLPHGQQQQAAQASHTSQASANSSKNQKGKKSAQQANKKANLPASASGSHGKRRAVSPARNQSSKQGSNGSSSSGAGNVSERERRGGKDQSRKLNNGVHDATKGSEKDKKKGDREEEEEEDEFLWDSSEEAEILDGDVGNGPVCMTDTPPVGMPFRPLPQIGKSPLVNGVSGGERVSSEDASGKQPPSSQQRGVPIFEVWNDSDDEDIVDESPLPSTWLETGGKDHGGQKGHVKGHRDHGEGQALPRTPELANIHQPDDSKVYTSTVGAVLAPPPSHPWERTQSAANFNDVNEHFVSLIRRVQSANPSRPLNSLMEESSSQLVQDANDDSYNVFSLSSVWGSESGLLSSKMALFNSKSNMRIERIDSLGKSTPSVQSADSAESQSEKQQKRVQSSYFSMLDALMEESTLDGSMEERRKRNTSSLNATESERKSDLRLLDEAVSTTQDSITVQEAIEDDIKCPLRSKLISELVEEKTSLVELEEGVPSIATELASVGLDTVVNVDHMIPVPSSSGERGSKTVPPPFYDESASLSEGGRPFSENFLVSVDFDGGSNLETLTDKVFDDEPLSPQQSLSMLQASLQSVVSASVLDPAVVSSFITTGDVVLEGEAESSDSQRDDSAMFDDPAIVSQVCIESHKETEQPNSVQSLMTLQGMSQDVQESFLEKAPTLDSPYSVEPISVFPSAYDEGIDVTFELSTDVHPPVIVAEEREEEEAEEGEEPRMSPNEQSQDSPEQSQTPVNEPSLEVKGDEDSSHSSSEGCGLEPADTPLPIEDKEELDEIDIVIQEPVSDFDQYAEESNPSSSAESAGPSSTFVSDLHFLTECFPDQDEDYVSTILRMCNERVDEALSVLLVSHSNQDNLSLGHTLLDTTDDGSSSISSASYSEQQLILNLDRLHPLDSSPEQQQRVARPVFSISGLEEEEDGELADKMAAEKELVPYFQETECENDEEIARALQEQLDLEVPSDSKQNKEGESVDTTGETAISDRQRRRSSSDRRCKERATLSGDENLELKLSLSLARQLQDMFGPVTDHLPFEGDMREEDMVVLLSERAAREIYKKWVDTLKAKKIGYQFQYRALSESNAISDEVLASLLQEEEDKKVREKLKKKHHKLRHSTAPCSLAALASENFRIHHNSSPPQLGHKGPSGFLSSSPKSGGNLAEIMDEQMAQQVHQNELAKVVEAKTGPNLSLRLQLKDLHNKFPDLEQSLVNETLVRNKFDMQTTIAELKGVVTGQPPLPSSVKDTIDGNVFGGGLLTFSSKTSNKKVKERGSEGSHGGRRLAKSKVHSDGEEENNEGAMGYQGVAKEDQPSYIELRAEAALHAKLRAQNFMKAAHARGRKQWEVAQYYAHQGHLHTEKMNEANQRAAKAILEHNTKSSDELDLHGLHVDEAIAALQEKLDSCKGSKLRVVTGQGLHSKGGGAKIRPAVISYLENKHYKILYERNAGALTVKVK